METGGTWRCSRAANEPEKPAMAVAMTSLGRLGRPDDLADVVAFLAGPDGRWPTGQNIRANGGVL
ncbi:SDR family oxidoreductase [Streptomyces sp. NPDC060275]|uniref:SDR family oxidoreductase n=1 Tax=Streptomyces sp. NPDC060275 TaxID=3347090 RepID=UPI0036581A48